MKMKLSTRLFMVVALTLLFSLVAVGAWAGGRQGTVPPPDGRSLCGTPGAPGKSFGMGTINVSGSDCTVKVTGGKNLIGNPPEGWSLLSEVLEVKIVSGAVSQVEVCVPLIPAWKNKEVNFFFWNATAWIAVPTTIKTAETPPVVCGTSPSAGFYALFGK